MSDHDKHLRSMRFIGDKDEELKAVAAELKQARAKLAELREAADDFRIVAGELAPWNEEIRQANMKALAKSRGGGT